MRKFVYPALAYYDEINEQYILFIEDLGVFAYGQTIEEAHKNAENMLATFLSYALKMDDDLPEPTAYALLREKYKDKEIILLEVLFDNKNKLIN